MNESNADYRAWQEANRAAFLGREQPTKTKEYTIAIRSDCRILKDIKLLVKALYTLPLDAEIVQMKLDKSDNNGMIKFNSNKLSYPEYPPLQFVVKETIKLKQQETK